jgi:hypothetical protein
MTAQIPDTIRFEYRDYYITGVRGRGLYHPIENGLEPRPHTTACWRGFACEYEIVDGQLLLMTLHINVDEPPDPFLGVPLSPSSEGISFPAEYRDLAREVPFSGEILAGDGFIWELYVHMGFHPAWKFERVQHFTFEQGLLTAQRDRSAEAAAFRKKVAKKPELALADIPGTFELAFDPWTG